MVVSHNRYNTDVGYIHSAKKPLSTHEIVLFPAEILRNWIRSGVRLVGDQPFRNGVLDENEMYNMLHNKTNMYCEVMLVKTALYQYCMNIVNGNEESVVQIRPLKSKEYYNVYLQQLACNYNITPITKYLDLYCNDNDDFFAFSKKVVLENEIKLKEFNFKVLHGILACNKNFKIWKIRLDDRRDVCNQIQTIEHLLFGCHYVKPLWQIVNNLYGINITFHQIF